MDIFCCLAHGCPHALHTRIHGRAASTAADIFHHFDVCGAAALVHHFCDPQQTRHPWLPLLSLLPLSLSLPLCLPYTAFFSRSHSPPAHSSITPSTTEPATPPVPKADAAVQVELGSSLPPEPTPLHPHLLDGAQQAITAAAAAGQLTQHLRHNQESAAVLAGLAAWLPADLVAAAEAEAAGVEAAALDGSNASAPGEASEGQAAAAGAAAGERGGGSIASAAGGGADAWREEARLAGSVVQLVQDLESSWGSVLTRLEVSQVGYVCASCGGC